MSIEKKVADLVKQGRQPSLLLPPSQILPKVKHGKNGRPRVNYTHDNKYDELKGHAGRRGKKWPRCYARGCEKYLKKNQKLVCSDACFETVFNHALTLLYKLGITKQQFLDSYTEPEPPKNFVLAD